MQLIGNSVLQLYLQHHPELLHVPYEPVSLPALPRSKCPHCEITSVRVSDTMTNPKSAGRGCIGKVLASGWCEEHSIAQTFLELGAKLRYSEVFLGRTGSRGVFAGLIHWEIYAQMTSARFLKEDVSQLKARYNV